MKTSAYYLFPRERTQATKKHVRRNVERSRFQKRATPSSKKNSGELFSDVPHLVWMTDANGQCIYINETFAAFTGTSPEALKEDLWTNYLHPHDVADTTTSWLASVREQTAHRAQYRIKRHDNVYRWMLARAVPIKDASGHTTHWVGTNTDIHELRQKWQDLQSSGMSDQDLMAAWAHHIRIPLTISRFKAEMTLLHREGPQYTAENMDAIMQDVGRIDTMMKDLFDDKSAETKDLLDPALDASDLRDILATSLRRLATRYPDRLQVSMPEQSVPGVWNATALQRALENLVGNAIAYGHPRTAIKVSLSFSERRASIAVNNQGSVLSQEEQRLLFEPALRIQAAEAADQAEWKLGLAMVKRIAQEHAGSVEVQSTESEGTTFRIVLPLLILKSS